VEFVKDLILSDLNKGLCGRNAEINAKTLVDAKVKAGGLFTFIKPKQINKETLWEQL
jgi:hypothetical protein